MSSVTLKEPPMSSNGSGIAQNRSISEIVMSLKNSFLDSDFQAVVRELKSREDGLRREKLGIVASLREKCDALKSESESLQLEKFNREEERRRLMRQCHVNDEKLNELTRELSLMKDKDQSSIRRYSRLHDEVREMENEKVELIRKLSDSKEKVEELRKNLREKENALEEHVDKDAQYNAWVEEVEEVKRRNVCLEKEKLKYDALLKREKDERMKELSRNEVEKSQIEAQLKAREDELEKAARTNMVLEDQKVKLDAQFEKLSRIVVEKDEEIKKLSEDMLNSFRANNESLKAKDVKIEELMKNIENLGMEKSRLTAQLDQVEERFSKLERDVITCMSLDLERDKRFASTHVGKIISGIIKVLDSEEAGVTCNAAVEKDGNTQKADSAFVSRVQEQKHCLKSHEQSVEVVKRNLLAEFTSKDEATGNEKAATPIINLDSDDDNENILDLSDASKKRKCGGSKSEQHNDDSSNGNSLNPKHKMMKSENAVCREVKQEASFATFSGARNDHKFNAAQKETLSTIRKCVENLSKEVIGSRCLLEDNGRKDNKGTPKSLSPGAKDCEEYMNSQRQKMQSRKLECRADMICALDQDDDLCAKAVCALYRQQKALSSTMDGSNLEVSKGLEECDLKRVTTLTEFLIDAADPKGKLKKSVAELKQHDPNGLEECRKLASKYSNKLIDIYKKRKDPLFKPMSSDLQYT